MLHGVDARVVAWEGWGSAGLVAMPCSPLVTLLQQLMLLLCFAITPCTHQQNQSPFQRLCRSPFLLFFLTETPPRNVGRLPPSLHSPLSPYPPTAQSPSPIPTIALRHTLGGLCTPCSITRPTIIPPPRAPLHPPTNTTKQYEEGGTFLSDSTPTPCTHYYRCKPLCARPHLR